MPCCDSNGFQAPAVRATRADARGESGPKACAQTGRPRTNAKTMASSRELPRHGPELLRRKARLPSEKRPLPKTVKLHLVPTGQFYRASLTAAARS